MASVTLAELAGTLEQLRSEMAEMSRRLAVVESRDGGAHGLNGVAAVAEQPAALPQVLPEPVPAGITEEELLAISAAIGAYLGVRAHIRQIRLLSTNAWAQQGRVSIQASHMLQA